VAARIEISIPRLMVKGIASLWSREGRYGAL
jgi:hypothetical protein